MLQLWAHYSYQGGGGGSDVVDEEEQQELLQSPSQTEVQDTEIEHGNRGRSHRGATSIMRESKSQPPGSFIPSLTIIRRLVVPPDGRSAAKLKWLRYVDYVAGIVCGIAYTIFIVVMFATLPGAYDGS